MKLRVNIDLYLRVGGWSGCEKAGLNNHNKIVQLKKKEAEALIQRELNGRLLTEYDRMIMNDQQVAQSDSSKRWKSSEIASAISWTSVKQPRKKVESATDGTEKEIHQRIGNFGT